MRTSVLHLKKLRQIHKKVFMYVVFKNLRHPWEYSDPFLKNHKEKILKVCHV